MSIRLNKILTALFFFITIFFSYPSVANQSQDKWQSMRESIQGFITSLADAIPAKVDDLSPTAVIGIFIAMIFLAIVFRGFIFIVIMFGVLALMFGNTEKATDYLKKKFNFSKDINFSDVMNKKENKEKK